MQTIQHVANAIIDNQLESELAVAMRRKLQRLSKAQALAWNGMTREMQLAYLIAVDRLEENK